MPRWVLVSHMESEHLGDGFAVSPRTAELLVENGWTPPTTEEEPER